jgi:DNA-directed RNA polymerase specialized sigma24 family protein
MAKLNIPHRTSFAGSKETCCDLELMCKVKHDNDVSALAELLVSIDSAVVNGLRQSLTAGEADEHKSDVHWSIWQHRNDFDEHRKFSPQAWGFIIARNRGRDLARRARRRTATVCTDFQAFGDGAPADAQPIPAVSAECEELVNLITDGYMEVLKEVLAASRPYVRTAFALRMCGVSLQAISEKVGRSVGTIAGALFRFQRRARKLVMERVGAQISPCGKGDIIMASIRKILERIQQDQAALERKQRALAQNQQRQERTLRTANGHDGLQRVLVSLNALVEGKEASIGVAEHSVRLAELHEHVENLRSSATQLPAGLFTKLWAAKEELRERFRARGFDGYSYNQAIGLARRLRDMIG